ncbi:MAG: alpha/beta hydrolase [Dehalococcoidia bacterium]|nr:alpha/beta hydrolase [Dehalococcoidia bacterium]MDW8119620.1 alpha/beta hydrolase [Chloroflexota bacterium]
MSTPNPIRGETLSVPALGNRLTVQVERAGTGPPVVFFHGAWGLQWDPFLEGLARQYTVYAPRLPGTGTDPNAIYQLDGLWDLVFVVGEVLDSLGVGRAALVGHSFGGMLAAEAAAHWPDLPRRVALIAPLGLWSADRPIANWMAVLHQQDLIKLLFLDPASPAVGWAFPTASDPQEQALLQARRVWAMGCSGKFWWPIPDRGLSKRLHRVRAPTLLVWGKQDAVVPASYAQDFARAIPHARTVLVEGANHFPHLERLDTVLPTILDFLQ